MPRNLIRLLLAMVLALAVPLQAFAAASGGVCMAVGHHDSTPAHGDHGSGDSHHDHRQPADSSSHCPPCSACCASAAIAPLATFDPADERTHLLNAAAPSLFAGIQRTVLDRPPLLV